MTEVIFVVFYIDFPILFSESPWAPKILMINKFCHFLCHLLCLLLQGKVFPSLSLQHPLFHVIRPSSVFLWSEGITFALTSLCLHYHVYLCHVLFHLSLVSLLIKQGVLNFSILLDTGFSYAPNQFERSYWQTEKLQVGKMVYFKLFLCFKTADSWTSELSVHR